MPVPPGAAEDVAARFQRDAVHGGQQLSAPTAEIDLLAGDLFAVLARHAREGSMPSDAEIAPFRARFDIVSEAPREVEPAWQSWGVLSKLQRNRPSLSARKSNAHMKNWPASVTRQRRAVCRMRWR